jgi:hypothetical protein
MPRSADTRRPLPGEGRPVEDFTPAFLVCAGTLLFSMLVTLWVTSGFLAPLAAAWIIDKGITRLSRSKTRQRR